MLFVRVVFENFIIFLKLHEPLGRVLYCLILNIVRTASHNYTCITKLRLLVYYLHDKITIFIHLCFSKPTVLFLYRTLSIKPPPPPRELIFERGAYFFIVKII